MNDKIYTLKIYIKYRSESLRFQLRITKTNNNIFDYDVAKDFHFAVIDLDKAPTYPRNFVCILPTNPHAIKNKNSKFSEFFGKDNVEIVKRLLFKALEKEDNDIFKHEIVRRLELLECPVHKKICVSCRKKFLADSKEESQRFCKDCWKRKRYVASAY